MDALLATDHDREIKTTLYIEHDGNGGQLCCGCLNARLVSEGWWEFFCSECRRLFAIGAF